MSWDNVDLKNAWWTIPAEISKNNLSHRVPLAPCSLKLLNQLQPVTGNQTWVFPSHAVPDMHISNINKAAGRIKGLAGVENFVPHDLRRTAASYMASLGVPPHVISKILNHVETGVTAVYNRHSYDPEKREALERWEKKLLEIVGVADQPPSEEEIYDPMDDGVYDDLKGIRESLS